MIRQLVRAPVFSLSVVAGLALAIGASTAVFSVFNAMLLRSMGFRDAASLVAIWRTDEAHGQRSVEVSYRDMQQWRMAKGSFQDIALSSSVNLDFALLGEGAPEHLDGATLTGNFFGVLGAVPLAGRLLTDEDDRVGAPAHVVISHRVWRDRFGGDPGTVGRQVRLGSVTATVVGVTRPEYDYPSGVDLWMPLHPSFPDVEKNAELQIFFAVGRLKPGVNAAQGLANLDSIVRHNESSALKDKLSRVRVTPMLDEIYGAARPAVWMLLGAVLMVLLIACVNATNLLLNHATERSRELAIRTALGASRWHLVKLLLTESAVFAAASGALGLLLAAGGVRVLAILAPAGVPRIKQADLDPTVLLFGVGLTLATVLLFGVGPALIASRRDPIGSLKLAGGSVYHGGLNRLLIGCEGALCTLLLVAAGVFGHSFLNMAGVDPGFKADRVLTFRITTEKPDQASRRAFFTEVLNGIRALPGVESAGAVLIRPLSGAVGWDTKYTVEGQTTERGTSNQNANYEAVSPGYFRTMGIQLTAGRDFNSGDTDGNINVVIVDQATAQRHWPQGNAVGQRIRLGANARGSWLTVVGVVKPVRYREWEAAWPDMYVPYTQRAQHRSDFVVKTTGDPWKLAAAMRRVVQGIDKNQPISNITTMDDLVDRTLSQSRFNGLIIGALGVCALVLAAIGIYSVLAYSVTRRVIEIGVRVAVGATPLDVARLVVRDGMLPLVVGIAGGLAVAMAGTGLLAYDPAAYGLAAMLLLLIALVACVAPALRAASIEPLRALRTE